MPRALSQHQACSGLRIGSECRHRAVTAAGCSGRKLMCPRCPQGLLRYSFISIYSLYTYTYTTYIYICSTVTMNCTFIYMLSSILLPPPKSTAPWSPHAATSLRAGLNQSSGSPHGVSEEQGAPGYGASLQQRKHVGT